MSFAATARDGILGTLLAPDLRREAVNYCKLMSGTLGRMALQALYFFVLANALTLAELGLFASASAVGLMLASFSGLGFGGLAFRAAAGQPRLLGSYLGAYFAGLCLTVPLGLALAVPVWLLVFRDAVPLTVFVAILLVEMAVWRSLEVLAQAQAGLGRYGTGSLMTTLGASIRAGGALLLLGMGGGLERWAAIYFVTNLLALVVVWCFLRPPVTLRLRVRLLRARLRDGLMFAVSYFALHAQGQADKVIVLSLADARLAGIYAIATRLVEFTALPLRSFYTLYTRRLIGEGRRIRNAVRRIFLMEAAILGISTLGFLVLVAILWHWPDLLGANIASAVPLLALMLAVPAFRNLLEFHGELYFVGGRMTARAVVAVGLVLLGSGALALLLWSTHDITRVGLWLNAIYAGLYGLSALALFKCVTGRA